MRAWTALAATAAAIVAVLAASGGSQAQPGTPTPDAEGRLAPDLVPILPGAVPLDSRRSRRRGTRRLLSFSSAVVNNGSGPLVVRTERGQLGLGRLSARQVVTRTDGRRVLAGSPLALRYVSAGGHSHFHLQDFMRYELHTVDGRRVRADRKQGFCLGDRYDSTGPTRLAAEPARAVFRGRCGLNRPRLTSLSMGISVGFGDDYPSGLEGQFIDITGLPSGRYVLVFRVDPSRRLLDQHRDNNVASMLLRIDRSARRMARILSWCPGTDSCTVAGRHRIGAPAWKIRG